jgi:hypothetical protein
VDQLAPARHSGGLPQHGLVSLWDMYELIAQDFYRAGVALRTIRVVLTSTLDRFPDADLDAAVESGTLDSLRTHLAVLDKACNSMAVPSTADAVKRLLDTIGANDCRYRNLSDLVRDIEMRLADDLKRVKMFVLDDNRAGKFSGVAETFGDVPAKFPSAVFDIDEAGKSFALARYTAAVFHLMRVMEIGIGATSRCLGIPDPTKPAERNWGFILRQISEALRDKKGTWATASEADFFDGLYIALDRVRNVWRNATMHVENKYLEDEALEIFETVRAFMKRLASRLDEDGKPLA